MGRMGEGGGMTATALKIDPPEVRQRFDVATAGPTAVWACLVCAARMGNTAAAATVCPQEPSP